MHKPPPDHQAEYLDQQTTEAHWKGLTKTRGQNLKKSRDIGKAISKHIENIAYPRVMYIRMLSTTQENQLESSPKDFSASRI